MYCDRFGRLACLARLSIPVFVLLMVFAGDRTLAQGNDVPAEVPHLNIRVDSNGIAVSGLVSSVAHEAILRVAVRPADGGTSNAIFDLREASLMPPGWALVTELALRAALSTRFSETSISDGAVIMRGVTNDAAGWNAKLARLQAALLPGMRLEAQVIEVPPSPDFAELCRQQFNAIRKNRSLTFVVASSNIETSGHSLLDSLVEAATDCPNAVIGIRANGDGPVSVSANRSLAEARANSIAEYLTARGLQPARIHVLPAADATSNRARQAFFAVSFDQAPDGTRESGQQDP